MVKKVLFFNEMLTPKIITGVYWLVLLFIFLASVGTMFFGYYGFTLGKLCLGLGYIAGGSIVTRIFCETLIIVFKINDNLRELIKQKKGE